MEAATEQRVGWRSASTMPGVLSVVLALILVLPLLRLSVGSLACCKVTCISLWCPSLANLILVEMNFKGLSG